MRPHSPLAILTCLTVATAAWAMERPEFEGKPPKFEPGQQTGAAIWTDGTRLHVHFAATKAARFSGKVCSRSPLLDLQPHALEASDTVKMGPKQRCVWLKLETGKQVDGFSVTLPHDTVIFDLHLGRKQLAADSIWVGAAGAHPDSSPFALPR